MRAPNIDVLLSTGRVEPLASFYEDRPIALVFLRHLGCVFCRRHVSQLRRYPDLNLLFVSMGSPEETEEFRAKLQSPHRFICDTGQKLYESFDLHRARWSQIVAPKVVISAMASMRYGLGRPQGDPMQLAGTFVIATDGEVVWSHRARDAADNASPATISEALRAAEHKAGVAREKDPRTIEALS